MHYFYSLNGYIFTAGKMSKYGVFSGSYFPAFGLNTERYKVREIRVIFSPNEGKYGPEKSRYLDTFHAVFILTIYLGVRCCDYMSHIVNIFFFFLV